MEYWHNPRCSKSREALALLEQHGYRPTIRDYLKDAPSADEIRSVVSKLRLSSARDLMRTKEAIYKELGLKDVSDEDQLIKAMADNAWRNTYRPKMPMYCDQFPPVGSR
mgnify:CR=1 FL=1